MGLADVHAHMTFLQIARQESEVLGRAREAGVSTIIANGLNPRDNQAVLELAGRTPLVKPALGFYPVDAVLPELRQLDPDFRKQGEAVTAEQGVGWLRDHIEQAFAVGEIGLDGHWVPEPLWERQEQVFRQLVSLALEADRVIIVHTRKRERRVLEVLGELGARRVLWHCFGGKLKLARQIAEGGHYLSVPANARRVTGFTRMLETLPRDRLLLETDCPYLGPFPGHDNEPANIRLTADYASELWKVPESEVEARLQDNFFDLFGVAP
jgi:TatD DNase family protein